MKLTQMTNGISGTQKEKITKMIVYLITTKLWSWLMVNLLNSISYQLKTSLGQKMLSKLIEKVYRANNHLQKKLGIQMLPSLLLKNISKNRAKQPKRNRILVVIVIKVLKNNLKIQVKITSKKQKMTQIEEDSN